MKGQTKGEKVDYFLSGALYGAVTVDRGGKFEKYLFDVLVQIWDEVEERIDEIGIILFADISSLIKLRYPHAPNLIGGKIEICLFEKWVIYFPDSLCDYPEAKIKFTIAHEFAHFMLGHSHGIDSKKHKKGEQAADDLAAKWGFPRTEEARGEEKRTKAAHSRDT